MERITSAANGRLKHLAKLFSQSKARRGHGQTVLEGAHLLQSYLQAGGRPLRVYIPETKLGVPEIRTLAAALPEGAAVTAAAGVLAKACGADELLALIDVPACPPPPVQGDCVVLDRVQDPGNVGTVMRSAAAAGVARVVLGEGCADAWSPKVLRAGMGAHFLLDVAERVDLPQWCASYTGRIFATALPENGSLSLYGIDLSAPAAWVFGNEGCGVDAALLEKVHACVRIPMAGQTESLNVAMAATVCLFEQMRQRHFPHPPFFQTA